MGALILNSISEDPLREAAQRQIVVKQNTFEVTSVTVVIEVVNKDGKNGKKRGRIKIRPLYENSLGIVCQQLNATTS